MENRFFYKMLAQILAPLAAARLFFKAKKIPSYKKNIAERFGKNLPEVPKNKKIIWLHAVSVGEMNAARPLLKLLIENYPNAHFLISTTTPTGRKTAANFAPKNATICYLPYDTTKAVARFLTHFEPKIALFMETEIWPETLAQLKKRGIPAFLINARLSQKSARGYAKFATFTQSAFQNFSAVLAQNKKDARRLRFLGAQNVQVFGNMKFDLLPDSAKIQAGLALKKELSNKFIWAAASTREGEEALILKAFADSPLKDNALLLLIPRHVERSNEIANFAKKCGLTVEKRSKNAKIPTCHVFLGDTMGELPFFYALADAVVMGGTLCGTGGQNFIEAAQCGCAVLLGPSTFNFAAAARDALKMQAAISVKNANDAMQCLQNLAQNKEQCAAMQKNAQNFAQSFGGAAQKTFDFLKGFLK